MRYSFSYWYGRHRDLHSFPTRRSSDLTALAVTYQVAEGRGELAIVPGPANGASRRQRREMEIALDRWTARVADYLAAAADLRSEEHTSELQSQSNLVCRLLLEKKTKQP